MGSSLIDFLRNYKNLLITSGLILLLLPFIYISLYVHPIADDFTYAVKGRTYDIFDNLAGEYLNWNGRYFSNFLVIINPITFGWFGMYKSVPVVLIVLTVFAFYIIISALMSGSLKSNTKLQVSLILTLLYLHQMPDLAEGIYWYTGAVTYHAGNIMFLFVAAMFIGIYNKKFLYKNESIHYLILTLLLFVLNGMNEIHVISLWLLIGSINLLYILKKKRINGPMMGMLIITVLFSLIVILSPGNEIRGSYFPGNHRYFESFYMSCAQTGRFLFEWCCSLPLLIASVLFYKMNITLSEKNKLFAASFYLKPWQPIILLLAVIFIGAFPAYWGTGILGQHRTMNVSYLLFLIVWFINLNVWYNRFKISRSIPNKTITTILYIGFFISIFFTKNLFTVSADLYSRRAERFDMQMYERYDALKSNSDTVYFAPIADPPESIFVIDISKNPDDWVNKGYTMYFYAEGKTILAGE